MATSPVFSDLYYYSNYNSDVVSGGFASNQNLNFSITFGGNFVNVGQSVELYAGNDKQGDATYLGYYVDNGVILPFIQFGQFFEILANDNPGNSVKIVQAYYDPSAQTPTYSITVSAAGGSAGSTASGFEGTTPGTGTTFTYTVTRTTDDVSTAGAINLSFGGTASAPGSTSADYTIASGAGTNGGTYASTGTGTGNLTFKAGQATATFTVTTTVDGTDEGDETVVATLRDGNDTSATATIRNDDSPPVLAINAGDALAYTENDPASTVAPDLTAMDGDGSNLTGATVTISAGYVKGEDRLAFTAQFGITGSFDPDSGTLTLTGSATAAQYQAVLRSVTYADDSDDPSTADRTITFAATDGTHPAQPVSRGVRVDAVNDPPSAMNDGALLRQGQSGTGDVLGNDTDAENDTLHVTAIAYRDTQAVADGGETSIQGRYGTLTIGSDGDYRYEGGIQGRIAVGETGTDTFTYTVSDGEGGTDTATLTLTVTGTSQGTSGNDFFFLTGRATSAAGGRGSDVYVVDGAADRPTEAGGDGNDLDSVLATADYTLAGNADIELLRTLDANSRAGLTLVGNALSQKIYGDAGANTIDGKGGADILRGYAGRDTFAFSSKLGAGNVDHIQDFSARDDTIALDAAVFRAAGPRGTLNANLFKDVTDGAALNANDRILYDHDTGVVSYDADGSGSARAVVFAILDTKPALTFQDFQVV